VLKGPGGLADSLQRREGVRDGPSADGISRIAGFTLAEHVPWLVYVGIPTEVALAPLHTRLYENIAAGSAMLVIGLLLAGWVAQRISTPLQDLAADAEALERGDLTHRSRVRRGGEIGALASTLNRMAEALQQRTASLEASQNRLRQLAEHDPLTGLPNRTLFLDRLNVAITRASRQRTPLALLFLDIDHFKTVNDTLGHEAGDELLTAFALRLQGSVRKSDTVARLAGDEFTVILEALGSADDARRIAETLLESARRDVGPAHHPIAISASIGLAMFEAGETAASMLRRADEALYAAKAAGRDRCCIAGRAAAPVAAVI
jgi:diguanylate cyclase (GGDEF)-like protein